MIFKHRELFFKLSLLRKSSTEIEIVFNGTGVICSKCYFAIFDFFLLEKNQFLFIKNHRVFFQQLDVEVGERTNRCLLSTFLGTLEAMWTNIARHKKCLTFAVFKNYISINKGEGRIQGKQEIQLCLKLRGKLYIRIQLDSSQLSEQL